MATQNLGLDAVKKPLKVVSDKDFFSSEISLLNLFMNELKKLARTIKREGL